MKLTTGCLAIAVLLALAAPAVAAEPYADKRLEEGPRIFRTNYRISQLRPGHTGRGLRSVLAAGSHWGSNGHWHFSDHGIDDPEQLWWRYWIRFDEGFTISPPDRGKLPGPAGLYRAPDASQADCFGGRPSTPENPCWSARMLFTRAYGPNGDVGPDDQTLVGFYLYHLDAPPTRGDILEWDRDVGMLDHGRWYCIEGYVALNTPGEPDGVLRGWVDGEPAFERTDLRFRRAGEEDIRTRSFWFNVYYGGDGLSPTRNVVDFDSIALGPQRLGCDDTLPWTGYFSDDDGHLFEADNDWLFLAGLTDGCGAILYCPDQAVTRGQLAAFLRRALELPPSSEDRFTDDDGHTFEADIQALAAAGITKGCTLTEFCPDDPVTRGQMAAFFHRAYADTLEAGTPLEFTDTAGSVFRDDIAWLSATGITRGCNADATRYCPDRPVIRGEIAAFLRRAGS